MNINQLDLHHVWNHARWLTAFPANPEWPIWSLLFGKILFIDAISDSRLARQDSSWEKPETEQLTIHGQFFWLGSRKKVMFICSRTIIKSDLYNTQSMPMSSTKCSLCLIFSSHLTLETLYGIGKDQQKWVFKLLDKSEIKQDLLDEAVYLFWPDDSTWYPAEVRKARSCSHSHRLK